MKKQFSLSKTIARMTDVRHGEAKGLLWLFLVGSLSFAWFSRLTYDIFYTLDLSIYQKYYF